MFYYNKAMSGAALAPAPCSERAYLLNQIDTATHELLVTQEKQVKAIMCGDVSANSVFRARLQRQRKHKDLLVARLLQHVVEHGCSIQI